MHKTKQSRIGSYIGALIGSLGWIIGFSIVCLSTGNTLVLSQFLFIGAIFSLSFFLILVIIVGCFSKIYGDAAPWAFFSGLCGVILFFAGTVMLLLTHWIAPMLDRYSSMQSALHSIGSVYKVNDNVSAVFLTLGFIFLFLSFIGVAKDINSK
jgi:hypothetical protein